MQVGYFNRSITDRCTAFLRRLAILTVVSLVSVPLFCVGWLFQPYHHLSPYRSLSKICYFNRSVTDRRTALLRWLVISTVVLLVTVPLFSINLLIQLLFLHYYRAESAPSESHTFPLFTHTVPEFQSMHWHCWNGNAPQSHFSSLLRLPHSAPFYETLSM